MNKHLIIQKGKDAIVLQNVIGISFDNNYMYLTIDTTNGEFEKQESAYHKFLIEQELSNDLMQTQILDTVKITIPKPNVMCSRADHTIFYVKYGDPLTLNDLNEVLAPIKSIPAFDLVIIQQLYYNQ